MNAGVNFLDADAQLCLNTGSGPMLRATNAIMAKCRDSIANGRRLPTFGFADDHLHGQQITTIQQLIAILSTGPAAEPSGRSSPLLLVGGGTSLCVLASRRWGPIYIASYTHIHWAPGTTSSEV